MRGLSIHYTKANVLHLGDVFFNGMYPFIDAGTGGSIGGMIAGVNRILRMADNTTKIVPGHGPLGDKAALTKYRDVLVTVRDRVQKLKSSGRKLEEVVAAKPTADLDATWAKASCSPTTSSRSSTTRSDAAQVGSQVYRTATFWFAGGHRHVPETSSGGKRLTALLHSLRVQDAALTRAAH